jgi:hypothetical protein
MFPLSRTVAIWRQQECLTCSTYTSTGPQSVTCQKTVGKLFRHRLQEAASGPYAEPYESQFPTA